MNTLSADAVLRSAFRGRLVADANPPPNLSLYLAPIAEDGLQDLHRLYNTYTLGLRARSPRRALEALWHELDLRDAETAGQELQLDATVLVRNGRASVLPGVSRSSVQRDIRRWRTAGFSLLDRRRLQLDLRSGAIVVPQAVFSVPLPGLLEQLASAGIAERAESQQPWGTFPIENWFLRPNDGSLADRVLAAAEHLANRSGRDGSSLVGGLAELIARSADLSWVDAADARARIA